MAAGNTQGNVNEVHPNPDLSKCDGPHSLTSENFRLLMDQMKAMNNVRGVPAAA